MTQPILAIFDLDYTMTQKGTWGRFTLQMARKKPYVILPLLIHAALAQLSYKLGFIPRIKVKQAMMKWCMVGLSRAELEAEAGKFADNEVKNGLRPGAVRALSAHEANGDKIIVVSAAADILVRSICQRLNIEHFMATEMDWDDNDHLKPTFATPNCYGPEKVNRLRAFLNMHENLQSLSSIMYSDSHSDIPIMEICDSAVAVNPNKKLRLRAPQYGFLIEDWDM